MAVNLSPVGGVAAQFFDNSGNVLTGGKIYTYLAGTTTPTPAYTTFAGDVAWSNPIILNAAGRVPGSGEIWMSSGVLYKFVLTDTNDVLIATYDNIYGLANGSSSVTVTATQGQTVFDNVGQVYVNGSKQIISLNYTQSAGSTTFVSGLNVGDVVEFV
jgi:hypothetical protein